MTFNNAAYGPGTIVRCDRCRDPEALMEARAGSEADLPFMGSDEATRVAVSLGFVRVGWRLLCGGCAKVESASTRGRRLVPGLRRPGRISCL